MTMVYQLWTGEKHPQTNRHESRYTTVEDRLRAEKNLKNRMNKNKGR